MGMAVAGSGEVMENFLGTLGGRGKIPFLYAENWVILSPNQESLHQLRNELGGQTTMNP
jgi:hypothetical protein